MIINTFKQRDPEGKLREYTLLQCDNCFVEYSRLKRFEPKIHGCSPKCLSILKGSRIEFTCEHCKKVFYRRKSSLKKSKSGKYFCSRNCKDVAQTYLKDIQPGHYGSGSYRKKALNHYGSKCNRCGYGESQAALEVHHRDRDRDRENNSIENLEVLCANCHRIEHSTKIRLDSSAR